MKKMVSEYIEPSISEKDAIWKKGVFVFDTNVLLNLYRFSNNTRKALLDEMQNKKDRIWMPYHVALEFMRNRYEVIYESVERYQSLVTESEKFVKMCSEQLRKQKDETEIIELKDFIDNWIKSERCKNLIITSPLEDGILDALLEMFNGKTGKKYTESELQKIKEEGKERYEKGFPPGYKDAKKQLSETNDNNMFGDLIVWKQIIEFAKTNKTDIIFVVNDQKTDWWNIVKGKTIGPRIELRKEFTEETSQKILFYTMQSFLTICNESKDVKIDESIIKEVEIVSRNKKRRQKENDGSKIENIEKQILNIERRIEKKNRFIETINMREDFNKNDQNEIKRLESGKRVLEKRLSELMGKQGK